MTGEPVELPWGEMSPEEIQEYSLLGEVEAFLTLAGRATRPEDQLRWYRAAAERGDRDAMFSLGVLLLELGHLDDARRWLEQAADLGVTIALRALGDLAVRDGDPGMARQRYAEAVATGDLASHHLLGELLPHDWRRQRDLVEAAAVLGHAPSMTQRGWFATQERDWIAAQTWYRRAIDAGDTRAMYWLGRSLISHDPILARRWLTAAVAADMDEARPALRSRRLAAMGRWWKFRQRIPAGMVALCMTLAASLRPVPPAVPRLAKGEDDLTEAVAAFIEGVRTEAVDRPRAEAAYQRAAALHHPGATRRLAQLWWRSEPDEAQRLFRQAVKLGEPEMSWWLRAVRFQDLALRGILRNGPGTLVIVDDPQLRPWGINATPGKDGRWDLSVSSLYAGVDWGRKIPAFRHPSWSEVGRFTTEDQALAELNRLAVEIHAGAGPANAS